MAGYAIKVIYGPLTSREAITFDRANYLQWKDDIEPGTRVLIYRRDPDGAIVAEVEVTGEFGVAERAENVVRSAAEERVPTQFSVPHSSGTLDRVDVPADEDGAYLLPVQILRSGEHGLVTRDKIREITGIEDFPREDEQWLPIDEQTYLKLAGRME